MPAVSLVIVAVLVSSCLRDGRIQGRVVDSETGEPVAGARVTAVSAAEQPGLPPFDPMGTATDANGLFEFSSPLVARVVKLTASKEGYRDSWHVAPVPEPPWTTITEDLELIPLGAR